MHDLCVRELRVAFKYFKHPTLLIIWFNCKYVYFGILNYKHGLSNSVIQNISRGLFW